ncbi:MAG: PIG-L family deacetylase [Acidobacteria bacterium]|nr:PIG-L family deacetylase [Acidobacteriota bacterium]
MIRGALLGAAAAGLDASASAQAVGGAPSAVPAHEDEAKWTRKGEIVVERAVEGTPHAGKVLAAIQPHADDVPLFAGGTVAKLIREGYTGYLIRVTNDEMTGGGTRGEGVLHNEQDNDAVARALGLKKSYSLAYRNHRMDEMSPQDLRGNLILLFRMLKVDTVVSYDHWGLYEENPDHYVTAAAVESACWMAGMSKDYPEQLEAGLKPHSVMEKYYYARGPQIANRVVDIGRDVKRKIASIQAIGTQGPGGNNGALLRQRLAARKLRLPVLGDNDTVANLNYVEHFVLDQDSMHTRGVPSDKEIGAPYGFAWAERFRYVGPSPSHMEEYIAKNAVAL